MEELLGISARYIGFALEAMAITIVAVGSIKAFFAGLGAMVLRPSLHDAIREVWLDYARYLIAALTFQLAADIVRTTVTPTWDDIGRLAAIAVTRTFLSYFLERDLVEVRERRSGTKHAEGAPREA
jgi:uncharacterized membrane protein